MCLASLSKIARMEALETFFYIFPAPYSEKNGLIFFGFSYLHGNISAYYVFCDATAVGKLFKRV